MAVPTLPFAPYTYAATFSESGLPSGSAWSVTIGSDTVSSATLTLGFDLANGTFEYAVGAVSGFATPSGGALTVAGQNVSTAMVFVRIYGVTFGEAGLPSGTSWSVTLGGDTLASTLGEINFSEPNGTYGFVIGAPSGYSPSPASVTLVVAGAPLSQGITFAPIPTDRYRVTFTESGLGGGIGWTVTVSNRTLAIDEVSAAIAPNSITFYLPNGTYAWVVYVPPGYASGVTAGTLTVDGGPTQASATSFSATVGGSPASPSATSPWFVAGIAVVVGAGGFAAGLLLRRRAPPKVR